MRILLAVNHFDFGGAQNHVRELANSLAERGHRIWVAAPPGRQAALLHDSVRHVRMSYSDLNHPAQALRLAWLARSEGIDVIHAHQRLPTLTACLVGRLAARPVVATLHGQLQHDLTHWPGAARMLARLIVVSPFFADLVARHSAVLAPKTVYIPNGVRHARQRASRRDGRLVVACAARIVPRVGPFLADLADAAADLAHEYRTLELHVFGDGRALPALAARAAAANRAAGRTVVRVEGYQPDLLRALAAADLAIGVGRVALEAMMQGIPLIPANHRYVGPPLTRERFESLAATNFVPQHAPPPDRTGLRAALAYALEHLPTLTREAVALRPRVERDYGMDAVTSRTEEVYRELAPGRWGASHHVLESTEAERTVA